MESLKKYLQICEAIKNKQIYQVEVDSMIEFEPVIGATTMDLHYNILYKKYLEKSEEDPNNDFQVAGALLHTLYFEQLSTALLPVNSNCIKFIEKSFADEEDLKDKIIQKSKDLHGSGWIYLSKKGKIESIKNHQIVDDVVLIIDCWEHAYIMDYQTDKKAYIENLWTIIDWKVISNRI